MSEAHARKAGIGDESASLWHLAQDLIARSTEKGLYQRNILQDPAD